MRLKVDIKGAEQFKKKLNKLNAVKTQKVKDIVFETALNIITDAKKDVAKHNGILATSIRILNTRVDKLGMEVGSDLPYAAAVEFGLKPGKMPPIDALRDWAAKKLGDEKLAYVVARKIKEKGTDAQPYLNPAFEKHKPKYLKELKNIFKK